MLTSEILSILCHFFVPDSSVLNGAWISKKNTANCRTWSWLAVEPSDLIHVGCRMVRLKGRARGAGLVKRFLWFIWLDARLSSVFLTGVGAAAVCSWPRCRTRALRLHRSAELVSAVYLRLRTVCVVRSLNLIFISS